jgi:hypothetical protein
MLSNQSRLFGGLLATVVSGVAVSAAIILPASAAPVAAPAATVARADLTDVYDSDCGGTFFVRQVDDQVWWSAESDNGGASWTNVFSGKRSGNVIRGKWADVPKGANRGSGDLALVITSDSSFRATSQTGGFGCHTWSAP